MLSWWRFWRLWRVECLVSIWAFDRISGFGVFFRRTALPAFLPSLGGAGVWVRGLPLGLGGLLVWLLLVLRRRLGLWGRFRLWWLVVVGPGRGWPSPRPRVLVVVWFPPVGPQLVWSFQFR